jgi:Gp37 protein
MNYTTLVDDIVTRLAPLLDLDIEVERLPETESEYTATFEKPRITVAYKRSQFGDENVKVMPRMVSMNEFVADEYAEIHVAYRSRLLYDADTGVNAVCLEAKKLLFGFMPTDWGRLFPREFELEKNEDGVWMAIMIFACIGRAVQNQQDDAGTEYPGFSSAEFTFEIT